MCVRSAVRVVAEPVGWSAGMLTPGEREDLRGQLADVAAEFRRWVGHVDGRIKAIAEMVDQSAQVSLGDRRAVGQPDTRFRVGSRVGG